MIQRRSFATCLAFVFSAASAQDIAPKDSERDPMISALTEGFEDEDIPSVTVDISATGSNLIDGEATEPRRENDEAAPDDVEEAAGEAIEEEVPAEEKEPAATPEPEGVTVNVEPGKDGAAKVDASAIKFLAPFAAKPLFQTPAGWRLEHPADVPAFVEKVPLSNGTTISLSIRPHVLVPDANGEDVLTVSEPGYDPALRYAQTGTMSAVLNASVERMEEDSLKMSAALERLGQLLGSLPAAPEAPPAKDSSPIKKQR